jgi:hypothetical protein
MRYEGTQKAHNSAKEDAIFVLSTNFPRESVFVYVKPFGFPDPAYRLPENGRL